MPTGPGAGWFKPTVQLINYEEFVRSMERLGVVVKDSTVRRIVAKGGRVIIAQAKRNAPYDRNRKSKFESVEKQKAHLRKAMFVHTKKRAGHERDVLIGVSFKKAPHAYLIEAGTKERFQGSKGKGKKKFMQPGKSVGRGPAFWYFKRALDAKRAEAAQTISDGFRAEIAKATVAHGG